MSLVSHQRAFIQDVARLIEFVFASGYSCTLGEGYRTQEQQDIYLKTGKTTVKYSQHQKRLAIDLNFFDPEGNLTYDKKELQIFGDFWESLSRRNRWGGNWKSFVDTPHFERRED